MTPASAAVVAAAARSARTCHGTAAEQKSPTRPSLPGPVG